MNRRNRLIGGALAGALLSALVALPLTRAAHGSPTRPSIVLIGVEGCVDETHRAALDRIGRVSSYGPMDEKKAIDSLKGIDIAVANPYNVPLTRSVLESTDRLKLLVISITGLDRVDREAASRKGILVNPMNDYSSEAVAEDAIALLLATIRHIPSADAAVRHGQFVTPPAEEKYVGFELAGKTLGIVGLGRIGTRVAEIARGFGMKVIAWDHTSKNVEGVTQVSFEQLLTQSDVVSLHLALNKETAGILGAGQLKLLRPTAVLVNTARSELVDEGALYTALHEGRIAGAGLDVVTDMSATNPLLTLDNVVVSPHIAYHSRESRIRCADGVTKAVTDYLADTSRR